MITFSMFISKRKKNNNLLCILFSLSLFLTTTIVNTAML